MLLVFTLPEVLDMPFLLLASAMISGKLFKAGFLVALAKSGFPLLDRSPKGFLPASPPFFVDLNASPFPAKEAPVVDDIVRPLYHRKNLRYYGIA